MELGEVYGKYRLIERIAHGGMAEVFKAVATGEAGFEKSVAIKRLHPQFGADNDLVAMLQDEARLCSQLHHGNICQVLDLGRVGDTYYIAMEYVNGKDLFEVLKRASQKDRPLPLAATLFIAAEMLAGLDYAHRKRSSDGEMLHIIHRDISPQNVLITWDGEVKIIDFGIAKARTSSHRTQAGVIKGKYRYMSPEQARGEPLDHRTDIFAAGVVLYEMILGRPHAGGATDREVLIKIQQGEFELLHEEKPGLPLELSQLVHRALELDLDARYSSARAFRKAIQTFARQNALPFSRDELGDYQRRLFGDDDDLGTVLESVESVNDDDLLGDSGPRQSDDAFAPALAPIDDPLATRQSRKVAPPAAEPSVPPEKEPPPPEPPGRKARPAGAPKPAPVPRSTRPKAEPPPGAEAARTATAGATDPVVKKRSGSRAALASLFRGVITLGLLGLIGLGGYYVYVLYFKKPGTTRPRKRVQRRKPLGRSQMVTCTLDIRSRPRGARIFLAGQDTGLKTPARLPDLKAPRMLDVELRHKRFKRPWRRTLELANGEVVRFEADLSRPPGGKHAAKPRRVRWRYGRRARPGPMTTMEMEPQPPADDQERDIAHLSIITSVKGAEVIINGKVRGKTPYYRKVRPSVYTIRVRHQGRSSAATTIRLRPGEEKVLRPVLLRQ